MADRFDTWESYFYPETINGLNGTLRNKFDERDFFELKAREYGQTARRGFELEAGMVDIPKTFDAEHLKAIHRHLFQDVYEWAGEFRTVNMGKGPGRDFGHVDDGEVGRYLSEVHQLATSTDWASISRNDFIATSATVFAYVNQAHPFREGNGRTSKQFMHDLAEGSPFRFEFDRVTPEQWNQASAMSRPDMFAFAPDPSSLVPIFNAVSVEKPSLAADPLADVRAVISGSYQRSPKEATRGAGQSGQQPPRARRSGPGHMSDRFPTAGLER
ncbi:MULTISPECIES: Fic family protein [Microbacterium]|uniref:Fic/DOC family protein n=1 Tax=Microbacterium TaxID=33882 RepID=UPI0023DA465D|nr:MULTISPECIES: Fic family protein [Microbacterium]MDF2047078.1 Fic family protein [Microbacterium sp. Kw_RZR3]MDF2916841.1 cell filamentation protein Fic [Microbacterium sp.]MDQ1074820.1 cell filamentation protein [Microbacterium sp. SORGH_AS_0969]MDQ1115045.1 cell filamentation protein [Microbacterium testaceum]